MQPEFEVAETADLWHAGHPPVLSLATYLASLDLFDWAGMPALIKKQQLLTACLEYILKEVDAAVTRTSKIITPLDLGCQLSVFLHGAGGPFFSI